MTVTYKGMTKDYEYRVAEIGFNEEKEMSIFEEARTYIEKVKGYEVELVTEGYAVVEIEDRTEFEIFANQWREAVKMVKNWRKWRKVVR